MRSMLPAVCLFAGAVAASAAGLVGLEKQILPMTKASWVAFRSYDGQQWIYFTQLVVYRCGLSEIRYSINDDTLDDRFPLPPCDLERPNEIDAETDPPYLTMPLGSAAEITVQVVYSDGEVSAVHRYVPCDNADDGACAVLVE